VGWFQGRMEFGPRALGARSILGDARSPAMQSVLNLKVKYRESFRPFAPSVLREDVADWFELDSDSPYMLMVADVAKQHRREMTAAEQEQTLKDDYLELMRRAGFASVEVVEETRYAVGLEQLAKDDAEREAFDHVRSVKVRALKAA